MNLSDIAGIIFIVIGLLCVLLTAYVSPFFLIVSGGFISAGIVLMITAGNMCRAQQDVTPGKDQLYATLQLPDEPAIKALKAANAANATKTTKASLTPPLTQMPT